MTRLSDGMFEETLASLKDLWAKGKPFFLRMDVGAPYDGCFHEPAIFLVTPGGEKDGLEMQYAGKGEEPVVWPLYATGQARAMDACRSLEDLVTVCEGESLMEISGESHFLMGSRYGRLSLIAVEELGPITDLIGEPRYWEGALAGALEHFGLSLQWECPECEDVLTYTEYAEDHPVMIGYCGDGGVGLYPEVVCQACYETGACPVCEARGCPPHEAYTAEIAAGEVRICEYCAEELLKQGEVQHLMGGDERDDDLPAVVVLQEVTGDDGSVRLDLVVEGREPEELEYNPDKLGSFLARAYMSDRLADGIRIHGKVIEAMFFHGGYGREED